MERLVFYMVNFSGHIERDGLKLCQEWVRNTVDPDLVEVPYNKDKLRVDIDSMKGMIEKGIERGELKKSTPVDALANALVDVIYGEMLCWDMSGGAYSFEKRTKEFCNLFLPAMIQPYIRWEMTPPSDIRSAGMRRDSDKKMSAKADPNLAPRLAGES